MKAWGLLALVAAGCAEGGDGLACVDRNYESQFSYRVKTTVTTPEGIRLDPTGQDVDPALVDRLTDEVEACLAATFGTPARLPADVVLAADCESDTFTIPLARSCFAVKVPDDWVLSCAGDQEVLPSHAPDALCLAKGLVPSDDCPCRWRAGIQDQHVIVTTPSFHMYKDPLVRLATGCNNPWGHPALAACAMPDPE